MSSSAMTPLAEVVDLSILLGKAAQKAGIHPTLATRFLDELLKLPGATPDRIFLERAHEQLRRANARARRAK